MVARVLAVNIVGVTNTLVPFVPAMVAARRGTLAAVSSIAGFRPLPGRVAYSTSKAAVTHFMEGLRQDLHGTGVHAMAICPGYVRTPMTEGMKSMPFAVDVDEAARRIDHALARRGRLFTFPWQMSILRRILELAPEPTMRRLAPPPRRRP